MYKITNFLFYIMYNHYNHFLVFLKKGKNGKKGKKEGESPSYVYVLAGSYHTK